MKIVQATLWIYAAALQKSWQCVAKNWIVSLAPLAYGLIMSVAGLLALPLGFLGGFLLTLASQACLSSGLHLIKNMIASGKANVDDFLNGFSAYLWDLLTVALIIWIPMRIAAMALGSVPNGGLIYFLLQVVLYILLNPVPEFIYQTRTSGLELLTASYNFIVENSLEWLLPNIIITAVGFFLLRPSLRRRLGVTGFSSMVRDRLRIRFISHLFYDLSRFSVRRAAWHDPAQPGVSPCCAQF